MYAQFNPILYKDQQGQKWTHQLHTFAMEVVLLFSGQMIFGKTDYKANKLWNAGDVEQDQHVGFIIWAVVNLCTRILLMQNAPLDIYIVTHKNVNSW